MCVVQYFFFGDLVDVFVIVDVLLFEFGFGEVCICIVLVLIYNYDLLIVCGLYGYKLILLVIVGSEVLGVVDVLGEGVQGLQIGQCVVVVLVYGIWVEVFIVLVCMVILMLDVIFDEMVVQLIVMLLSVLMLLEFLYVEVGQWIVQNIVNGVVGKLLVMLVKVCGVYVVNLVCNVDVVVQLQVLGVDYVFDILVDGWKECVCVVIGEVQVVVVVDFIGGDVSGDLVDLFGYYGMLVLFGVMSGELMYIFVGGLIYKEVIVKGFWGSKVSQVMVVEDKCWLVGELLKCVVGGELMLLVEQIFVLDDIVEVVKVVGGLGCNGKVLLQF